MHCLEYLSMAIIKCCSFPFLCRIGPSESICILFDSSYLVKDDYLLRRINASKFLLPGFNWHCWVLTGFRLDIAVDVRPPDILSQRKHGNTAIVGETYVLQNGVPNFSRFTDSFG